MKRLGGELIEQTSNFGVYAGGRGKARVGTEHTRIDRLTKCIMP